jgi:hypothetical protein
MCVREKKRERRDASSSVTESESYLPRGAAGRSVRHDGGRGVDIGSHVATALLHTKIALEIPNPATTLPPLLLH